MLLYLLRQIYARFQDFDGRRPTSPDQTTTQVSGWDLHVVGADGKSVFELKLRSQEITDFETTIS